MTASITPTLDILANPLSADAGAVAADIDRWTSELGALGQKGETLIADLNALKSALVAGGEGVGTIMAKLGHATAAAANGNADLQALGARLSSFGV